MERWKDEKAPAAMRAPFRLFVRRTFFLMSNPANTPKAVQTQKTAAPKTAKTPKVAKEKKKTEASRYISERETLRLWVASGGRCAMPTCNKFLLEEESFLTPLNLGERAHIAGWNNTTGSPRGDSDVPLKERGKAENLILLCAEHHKTVDSEETRANYPEQLLLEFKHRHEERIHHLTAMAEDQETAVLRVFGEVRGSTPEMAKKQAARAVVDGAGRYAKFPFSVDNHSIEIDLVPFANPEQEGKNYWAICCRKIDRVAQQIAEAVHEKHTRHISVFAVARMPLLVYLGYVLDDKVPVDLYQKQRGGDEDWIWPDDSSSTTFEIVKRREGNSKSGVAVVLCLSGTIDLGELSAEVADLSVYEIRPVGEVPGPDLFCSQATLDTFNHTYRNLLAQLEQDEPEAKVIHLFPSAPITAAISCGRYLMRHIHPALRVYDRIENDFQYTLTINES